MTNTFTWPPDNGAKESHEPSRREVRFGDGYGQRSPNGLNPDMPLWKGLSWSGRSASEISDIVAFLDAQGSVEPFNWTPPGRTSGLYICPVWERRYVDGPVIYVTADFIKVPA